MTFWDAIILGDDTFFSRDGLCHLPGFASWNVLHSVRACPSDSCPYLIRLPGAGALGESADLLEDRTRARKTRPPGEPVPMGARTASRTQRKELLIHAESDPMICREARANTQSDSPRPSGGRIFCLHVGRPRVVRKGGSRYTTCVVNDQRLRGE